MKTTKEIAKQIRSQLKEEFKDCKLSVTTEYFSGGSAITVALMKADRKIKLDFDKIPENALNHYIGRDYSRYTEEELKRLQGGDYHQLSESAFYHYQKYEDYWNNGVFLTYQGYTLLKRVCQIVEKHHRVDSDIQTDYYNTNFYFHLALGKWDKPFIDGTIFKPDQKLENTIKERDQQIKENIAKNEEEKRLKEIEEENYRKIHKRNIPTTATHIIDGSGLRPLTEEERITGKTKEELFKKWFGGN